MAKPFSFDLKIKKTKDTLFYETSKVEYNKVPLLFHFGAKEESYWFFVILTIKNH